MQPDHSLSFIPPVIAHRGSRCRAPENTMAAFMAAREDGALWIETDVKLTSDGMPILFHDEAFDRTSNGDGLVADKTWSEIQQLDAGSWFGASFTGTRVTAMAELLAFAVATGMRLNLEMKPCPGRAKPTVMVSLIEAAKLWPEELPPPLISSFDVDALIMAAQLQPDWPRGLLLDEWHDDWADLALITQASTLNFNADLLTPERMAVLRSAQKPILAYTVNDPARARALLQMGVTAVFSDNPAEIIKSL